MTTTERQGLCSCLGGGALCSLSLRYGELERTLSKSGTACGQLLRGCPCARGSTLYLTRSLSSFLGASVFPFSVRAPVMPTSQGCGVIKGGWLPLSTQPPGTKIPVIAKMFGSTSPACEKGAPTDLKESDTHRRGEAHRESRPTPLSLS